MFKDQRIIPIILLGTAGCAIGVSLLVSPNTRAQEPTLTPGAFLPLIQEGYGPRATFTPPAAEAFSLSPIATPIPPIPLY